MIYVPEAEKWACVYVQGDGILRAYESMPRNNTTINYREYFTKSNYLYRDGQQQFSQYATLPTCLDKSTLTNDVYYRNDFASILVIFSILSIVCFGIPLKIFFRLFKKR